jgi:outer membrane protein assembly factor BamB
MASARRNPRNMARQIGAPGSPRRIPPLAIAVLVGGLALVAVLSMSGPGQIRTAASGFSAGGLLTPAPSGMVTSPAAAAGAARSTPSTPPSSAPVSSVPIVSGAFAGDLLIADRGNDRILIVNSAAQLLWHFPVAGSLPAGQTFSADDAFLSPDGRTIVANEETRQVVVRIDIASRRVVWEYGHYGRAGSGAGYLHTPDDAYPLANGDVIVADILNCRVVEIAPDKHVVRQWGHTGVCRDAPPYSYGEPNGDTPLADGGVLITEIRGSRVVRLDAAGRVVFNIHVPTGYPSDAQLDSHGDVVVADYSNPGAIVAVSPTGHLLWRYGPRTGPGRLDHPSLAVPLADGTIILNDDLRHRVILLDPRTGRILWQYGRTDAPGSSPGRLNIPDGINLVPPGAIQGL